MCFVAVSTNISMNITTKFILAFLIIGIVTAPISVNAATLYSTTAGGEWNTSGTWTLNSNGTGNCSCTPVAGDILNVRAGTTVSAGSDLTSASAIRIYIYGLLDIPGNVNVGAAAATIEVYNGGELNITGFLDLGNSSSVLNIFTGGLLNSNGSNSSKIRIGGTGG